MRDGHAEGRPDPVLHNPFTGKPRHPLDIASDPGAVLCVEPGTPWKAASFVTAKPEVEPRLTPQQYIAAIGTDAAPTRFALCLEIQRPGGATVLLSADETRGLFRYLDGLQLDAAAA